MITVTFHSEASRIVGFETRGHADLAEPGQPDILCAAVTSAVRLIETTVNDVLGLGAAVKVKERDALIALKLPGSLGQTNESTCQTLLAAFMVYCAELHEEYPQHLEVINLDSKE
ncbi:MAG: ribosomal-processing cysteine protease Prp [Oscillospiraceae bacterium]